MSESKVPALAEKMQALLEKEGVSLSELLKTMGLQAVKEGDGPRKKTRKAIEEAWKEPRELQGEELDTIKALPEVIGSGVMPTEPRDLTQVEVDGLMAEELKRRDAEDILKGRYAAIRTTVFNAITLRNEGDEFSEGALYSPEYGYKFERGISNPSEERMLQGLEGVVDEDIWENITDVEVVETRTVNKEKLLKAVSDGKVTHEQLEEAVSAQKPVARFYVKPIKKGEVIE